MKTSSIVMFQFLIYVDGHGQAGIMENEGRNLNMLVIDMAQF